MVVVVVVAKDSVGVGTDHFFKHTCIIKTPHASWHNTHLPAFFRCRQKVIN
jgi:hypothetical protein